MVDVTFSGWGNWNESDSDFTIPIGANYKVQYMDFSLTEDDEREYAYTTKLDHVKQLLPAIHIKNCEFSRIKKIFINGVKPDYPAFFIADESVRNSCPKIDTVSDPVFVIQNNEENILNISKSLDHSTKESDLGQNEVADEYGTLTAAIQKFWANADVNETDTHPTNEVVSIWLMERNFKKQKAAIGASIIRPRWAVKGRPRNK